MTIMVNHGNVYGYIFIYMDIFRHIYIYTYVDIYIYEIFGSTKKHMEVFLGWR